MVKLAKTNNIRRAIRIDEWEELSVPTVIKTTEAIDSNRLEEAKSLCQYIVTEGKGVHDVLCDWIWNLLTYVAETEGEDAVYKACLATQSGWMMKRTWKAFSRMSVKEQIYISMELMRSHRGGPCQLGETPIVEEEDRYVLIFDPCGSGGRMRRGDPVDGTPPRTRAPYNFGVTKKAYPWSFGLKEVPYYCIHCCVNEILCIEWGGYPLWVTEYNSDPDKPCAWVFYKHSELIPEKYFTRVGKSKPPS